jgi:hypothetical protein
MTQHKFQISQRGDRRKQVRKNVATIFSSRNFFPVPATTGFKPINLGRLVDCSTNGTTAAGKGMMQLCLQDKMHHFTNKKCLDEEFKMMYIIWRRGSIIHWPVAVA